MLLTAAHMPLYAMLAMLLLLAIFTAVGHWVAVARPDGVRRVTWVAGAMWLISVLAVTLTGVGPDVGQASPWFSDGIATLSAPASQASETEKQMVLMQWMLNALLFTPLAPVLSLARKRPIAAWRMMAAALAISVGVETLQWVLAASRVPDAEDVVCNVLGAAVGIVLVAAVRRVVATYRRPRYASTTR
ncbi:VanZ family protein [Streptomyces sp. MUM 178J]|uniref:VanZ family protein n=1 Tax=Streptomyces sp. MUM 178J TaxID=2791991 RepID=UPI001F047069|nr:VanZ family protein [Streptomyces sp. MUM 178J]WRQ81048.1 VanZ family protein [Streptomyces sp. MUM 178J]